jgi:hypothetical protein
MPDNSSIASIALVVAMATTMACAQAVGETKYPDWKGQWLRIGGGGQYDPSKPPARGQQPPLTPEYRAVWDRHMAEAAAGGQNYNPQAHCLPGGMPRMMVAYEPMEVIVTPEITYIPVALNNEFRRIFTDGRDWPKDVEPSYSGYSIGRWVDQDGDGRYDVLEVETRGLKGPRTFDPSGIPLHTDNLTVVRERMYLDKANPDILRDEITTIDHALTRPWTITRSYQRDRNPTWVEYTCAEANTYVFIGPNTYTVSADGHLMPLSKDQPAPDLRYFTQKRN